MRKLTNLDFYCMIVISALAIFLFNWNFIIKHPANIDDTGISTHLIYSQQILKDWIQGDGYISHLGLFYDAPSPDHPNGSHYLSTSFINILPYFLQKIAVAINGDIQIYWMVIYSMALSWFVSILIGFLAFSISRDHVQGVLNKLIVSISPMLVFQTMPMSLMYYWGYTPQLHFMLFGLSLIFLLNNFYGANWQYILIVCLTFLSFSSEYVASLFLCFFLIFLLLLTKSMPRREIFKISLALIVGISIYSILKFLQYYFIKLNYPDMGFSGTSFLVRSWFDGDQTYLQSWFDVFSKKYTGLSYGVTSGTIELIFWRKLLFVGGCVLIYLIFNYEGRYNFAYTSCLSLFFVYLLYCFIFPQAIVLHSDFYEILLMVPIFLTVFTVFPMMLFYRRSENPFIGLLFLFFAVGYSINSLRFYYGSFKLIA